MKERFKIIKLNSKYISSDAKIIFAEAAKDLFFIKKELGLYDIAIRGGFVVDTLIGKKAKDIDIFYIAKKENSDPEVVCNCNLYKTQYETFKSELSINNYPIDWGHYGNGEAYQPIVNGICGYFTQSVDFMSLLVLDSYGDVWTNSYGLYCLKNRVWEITPMTWMTYLYFMADKKVDFYDLYCGIALKGVRHILSGKAKGIGPMYRELLENLPLTLTQIGVNSKRGENIRSRFNKDALKIQDVESVLNTLDIIHTPEIIKELNRISILKS